MTSVGVNPGGSTGNPSTRVFDASRRNSSSSAMPSDIDHADTTAPVRSSFRFRTHPEINCRPALIGITVWTQPPL
jgi:hypothetical protein